MTTPQGWQCPKCEAVYAPFVLECHRCAPLTQFAPTISDKITITIPPQHYPSEPIPAYPPCLFDNLPPGVYGLVCTCPRCSVWCGTGVGPTQSLYGLFATT